MRRVHVLDRFATHDAVGHLPPYFDERRVERGSSRFLALANGLLLLPYALLTARLEAEPPTEKDTAQRADQTENGERDLHSGQSRNAAGQIPQHQKMFDEVGGGMASPGRLLSTALHAPSRKNREKRAYDVHTRTRRLHIRLDPAERDALDFLASRWASNRSEIVRSMIVGAALAECDRLDALDTSFDDVLAFPGLEVK